MGFSKTIEDERKKRNMNKAEMAIFLGMSERMYDYYVAGKYDGSESRTNKYLEKLSETSVKKSSDSNEADDDFLKAKLFMAQQNEKDLRKLIEVLERANNDLSETNKTLNKVINKQLS